MLKKRIEKIDETVRVQDQSLKSNGIYSVMNDEWIKEPVKEDIPEIDREAFDKEFKVWEDRYNEIILNPSIEEIDKFMTDIYEVRKQSLNADGEYGIGNLIFKELRSKGYLDSLKDTKKDIVNKKLSLN